MLFEYFILSSNGTSFDQKSLDVMSLKNKSDVFKLTKTGFLFLYAFSRKFHTLFCS